MKSFEEFATLEEAQKFADKVDGRVVVVIKGCGKPIYKVEFYVD